jgi:hypothetical protein
MKFEKEKKEIWRELFLHKEEKEYLQPKIWFELKDVYPTEMKEFFEALENKSDKK